jgi:hypothetical protein
MTARAAVAAAALALCGPLAAAAPLTISLDPDPANPASPRMGDWLHYHTVIRNEGATPVEGLTAWISLIQVDKGKEQPVDLEDWSAHKAVTAASLAPGSTLQTEWPMRLIQSGHYRVVVSAASRDGAGLTASPFADFAVRSKPVVESQRVLPVALGLPLIIAGAIAWRSRSG